jgi:hypothetical protein
MVKIGDYVRFNVDNTYIICKVEFINVFGEASLSTNGAIYYYQGYEMEKLTEEEILEYKMEL